KLGFARAPGADPATQLRHLDPAPGEARQQVLKLRQFHLQLAFACAGMGGENVEDQLRSINNANMGEFLDVPLLRCGQVVIEQQYVSGSGRGGRGNFLQLSLANEGGRIRTVAALQDLSGDFRSALAAKSRSSLSDSSALN